MYGYVYKTTNLTNGKIYIGQHKHDGWDNNYYGSGKILLNAIKKYGRENFSCEPIEYCDTRQDLDEREIYWIDIYRKQDNCYNIAKGGGGRSAPLSQETKEKLSKALKGRKIPIETRKKMALRQIGKTLSSDVKTKISQKLAGRTLSEEHRAKLSLSHIGQKNPHSEDWRRKVSQANKGRTFSEMSKQKMSLSHRGEKHPNYGKHLSVETRNKISEANKIANKKLCKKVVQIDYKTKQVIAQYDSIKDAERKTGINSVYISQLCRGKGKQCFGYSWQYIEDLGEEK